VDDVHRPTSVPSRHDPAFSKKSRSGPLAGSILFTKGLTHPAERHPVRDRPSHPHPSSTYNRRRSPPTYCQVFEDDGAFPPEKTVIPKEAPA
jgi:hypothetical protein